MTDDKILAAIEKLILSLKMASSGNQVLIDLASVDYVPAKSFMLYVPAEGVVKYDTENGDVMTVNLIAGYHPVRMRKIWKTGTVATGLIANF